MTRLTLLLVVAVLALPSAAIALPARDVGQSTSAADSGALATERYYSSYGTEPATAVSASEPVPAASGNDGPSWFGAISLGLGLALLAGGLGLYGGRVVHPRHLGT